MHRLKSAKIYFCFAVLLFVAKPFLGFGMFNSLAPPADENIFIKAFSKRKQDYAEDSNFDIIAVQKKLADPGIRLLVRFSSYLSIIFPAVFDAGFNINNQFLRWLQLSKPRPQPAYLLNSKFII